MIDLPYLDDDSRVAGASGARAQVAGYLTTAETRLAGATYFRYRVRQSPTRWVADAGYRETRHRLAEDTLRSAQALAGSVAAYCDDMATASRTIREYGDEYGYALTDQLDTDRARIREQYKSLALSFRVTIGVDDD